MIGQAQTRTFLYGWTPLLLLAALSATPAVGPVFRLASPGAPAAADRPDPSPRYLLLNAWTFQVDANSRREFQCCIDAAAEQGFNALRLSIAWANLETSPGRYDFALFDQYVDYARVKGMKVALSLHLNHRAWDKLPPDWLARDSTGRPYQLSFASAGAMAKVQQVLQALAEHYARKCPRDILFVQVTFSPCAETEFDFQSGSDHSPAAINAFRKYLARQYGSIQDLNRAWKTNHATFAQVAIPADYSDMAGLAWYLFRTKMLKQAIEDLGAIVHRAGLAYGVQFGSVWDGLASKRGTILFPYLCEKADWITVDDAPTYDHCFSSDLLRGSLRGKHLANEVDGPGIADDAIYLGLGRESFEHGFDLVSVANWSAGPLRQRTGLWKPLAQMRQAPVQQTPAVTQLKVSALELLRQGPQQAIQRYRQANPDGKKILDLVMIDDITPAVFPEKK